MVFFPGQVKTLHIFEPRYKDLLQTCIRTGSPFGIVLASQEGAPQGFLRPSTTGTLAHIFEVRRQPDDTYLIQIYGGERFKVAQFYDDATYLQASISAAPLSRKQSHQVDMLAIKVSSLLDEYLDALTAASGIEFQVTNMPETPEQLAFLTADILQINHEQKQSLLETESLPAIFRAEIGYLYSELDLMEWINNTIETPLNNLFIGPGPVDAVSLN